MKSDKCHGCPLAMSSEMVKVGSYSNSQNGDIFISIGISPCLCSGGDGHDATIPKYVFVYEI